MKNWKKAGSRLVATLLVCCLVMTAEKISVKAENVYDAFLLETGMPQDVLKKLDAETKAYIYETAQGVQLIYDGYEEQECLYNESLGRQIPLSELNLSVTSFVISDGIYYIYPSFEWKIRTNVKGDCFAFGLDNNKWHIFPEENNLRIWNRVTSNDDWKMVEDFRQPTYTNGTSGFGWRIPSDYSGLAQVKGNAFVHAKPINGGTPDKRIVISYADVINPNQLLFSGISIAIKGLSITYTANDMGNIREGSNLFGF